ncbi:hypothetical protein [Pseudovibrio axinellae]|uniref:hypothetical protein n=1 Tax=Pseudovibrio axinellae TaxID=989403 RepID=UPI000829FB10|nr:hypothetical protein [Pseudovibrio axinellae]
MNDTPCELPSVERIWERAGPPRKIIGKIKERFGTQVSGSTIANWRSQKTKPNPDFYWLIAEMSEYTLEQVYLSFHPNSRGASRGAN